MDRETLARRIRALRERLAQDGVTHVALSGSRARGDHRPDSDVDLLIEVEDDRLFSLLDLVGVQHVIGDDTGLTVNAVMKRSLSPLSRADTERDIREVF